MLVLYQYLVSLRRSRNPYGHDPIFPNFSEGAKVERDTILRRPFSPYYPHLILTPVQLRPATCHMCNGTGIWDFAEFRQLIECQVVVTVDCCCLNKSCLNIKNCYDRYSVPSNIRTGPTDANAFRGHRLTTQKGYTL